MFGGNERDQVALLTGPGVNSILGAALAPLGLELVTSRVHSVHHRPGAGVTVGYTAVVRGLAGIRGTEYLCATTAHLKRPDAPGLVRVDTGAGGGLHPFTIVGATRRAGFYPHGGLPPHPPRGG